jgi:hypothetical protein
MKPFPTTLMPRGPNGLPPEATRAASRRWKEALCASAVTPPPTRLIPDPK